MSDVPDSIYLLIARPHAFDGGEEARTFNLYSSYDQADVVGWFTSREDAEEEYDLRWASHNPDFGPPKHVLSIAEVRME